MNALFNFVWEYRFIIVLLIAIVMYASFEWEKFKREAYRFMLAAKKLAKDAVLNSGEEQEEWVVEKFSKVLPKSITIWLGEDRLRSIVKYLYDNMKDLIDDGKINKSI